MMHVLLVTDAFPPICGGSGWSTYELARGLRRLGHEVSIVRPRPGQPAGVTETRYEDFTIHEVGAYAPPVPYVRNYFKNERLTRSLTGMLARFARDRRVDVIHGQHLLSTPAALAAARIVGVPGVSTVRDYWPVCYWSDLIHDYHAPTLCPGCSAGMMTRCIRPRGGAVWPVALPLIPYMRANLRRKREALSRADAVIAVSSTIGRDLAARAPELAAAGTRIEIIPNPVDVNAIRAAAAAAADTHTADTAADAAANSTTGPFDAAAARHAVTGDNVTRVDAGTSTDTGTAAPPFPPSPYAIYVGKLAPNKGTGKLMTALARAQLSWPLVIVGDGPDRAAVEAEARASGRDVRFTGWLSRADALRWLGRASLLVFPSHGPESLSRVLLEASALGVPAAAMDTGGTRDIIQHERTGLLSTSPEELGDHIARLVQDAPLRARLGEAARAWVDARFDAPAVVSRIVSLYEELRAAAPATPAASASTPAASAPARHDDATSTPRAGSTRADDRSPAHANSDADAAARAAADKPRGTSSHA